MRTGGPEERQELTWFDNGKGPYEKGFYKDDKWTVKKV